MLTVDEVKAQVARITHEVDGHKFSWNVTYAYESDTRWPPTGSPKHIGYFVQITYYESDIDNPSGEELLQEGRKWFVERNVTASEVIQTCLKAALASAEHRTREWFLVDGVRAYGPHQTVEDLVQLLKSKQLDETVS